MNQADRMHAILSATPGVVTHDLLRFLGVAHPNTRAACLRKQGHKIVSAHGLGYRLSPSTAGRAYLRDHAS